ncbi:MAG: PadR family transcriptional regulator [Gaiellales bacterium]|nr:PadR family transcriptional regulator [Gaiellales bacterium]
MVGDLVHVDPGSIYGILQLLEEAGMVSSTWEVSTSGPSSLAQWCAPGAWAAAVLGRSPGVERSGAP